MLYLELLCWYLIICSYSGIAATGEKRYLIYSVNPGEGFNLRRDVHMRAATLVKELRKQEDWVLVLPPWPHLYHWKSGFMQNNVKWESFFDLPSLNEYVPSIEFDEYLAQEGRSIDEVMHLQNFAEGWGGEWKEKIEERACNEQTSYWKTSSGWTGYLFGDDYDNVLVKSFRCVSIQGHVNFLVNELQKRKSKTKSFLIERFEILIHNYFGGYEYWSARNSMVYAKPLREVGNKFMRSTLRYDPGEGNGRREPKNGDGDFISVHLRRRDYLHTRKGKLPSLEGAAAQINVLKKELKLSKVFLATDSPENEKQQLAKMVKGLVWFKPSKDELRRYGDGGVAIIDQWVASHAKYFIGTVESTFSYRIREDRQFMGFSKESTFNQLCGPSTGENDPNSCAKPSYWKINDSVLEQIKSDSETHRSHEDL